MAEPSKTRIAGWAGLRAAEILTDERLSLLLDSRREAWDRLKACGEWAASLLAVGARVSFQSDRFDLDDTGEPSLIIEALDEFSDLSDACAIGLRSNSVATHSGGVWALGLQTLFPTLGEPIPIHRTPWQYLTAGRGLYVFDWDQTRRWRVETGYAFRAADEGHAAELHRQLEIDPAEIFFPPRANRRAA